MLPERRQYNRINITLPINYETLETPHKRVGTTVCKDISLAGARIHFDSFYPQKTKFLLKFNFENTHLLVEGIAETAWSVNEHYSNNYSSGVRFTEMNKENQSILKQYIDVQTITA